MRSLAAKSVPSGLVRTGAPVCCGGPKRPRLILRNDFNYEDDLLHRLNVEFDEILGVNYRFWRGERFKFGMGPGMGVRYIEPQDSQTGYTFSGDFSGDLAWKITDRISLAGHGDVLYDPEQAPRLPHPDFPGGDGKAHGEHQCQRALRIRV